MKYLLLTCSALLLSSAAFAQDAPAPAANANAGQPIEISATKTVEWLRNEKKYVARENVVVTQGGMTINTDLLTADYRETPQSATEIWQLTAEGNVIIKDDTNTAYGDLGVYDVTTGIATLTGQNLKLVSPDQTVTATERMEYYSNTRQAKAIGNAKVTRATDTLTADSITAFFKDGTAPKAPAPAAPSNAAGPLGGGGGNLDRLEADGRVVIITPTEKLYGNKGVYRAASNTAELIGKVKIERGENVLEGERAEVNLTTNVSKMFGSNKDGGRVRGVFFPGSEKPKAKGQDKPVVPAPFQAPAAAPVVAPAPAAPAAVVPAPKAAAPAPAPTPPATPVAPAPATESAAPAPVSAPAVSTPPALAPDLFPPENTTNPDRKAGTVSPRITD